MIEVDYLQAVLRLGAYQANNLARRVARQADDGEPLGALDIVNELLLIVEGLGRAGGVTFPADHWKEFDPAEANLVAEADDGSWPLEDVKTLVDLTGGVTFPADLLKDLDPEK